MSDRPTETERPPEQPPSSESGADEAPEPTEAQDAPEPSSPESTPERPDQTPESGGNTSDAGEASDDAPEPAEAEDSEKAGEAEEAPAEPKDGGEPSDRGAASDAAPEPTETGEPEQSSESGSEAESDDDAPELPAPEDTPAAEAEGPPPEEEAAEAPSHAESVNDPDEAPDPPEPHDSDTAATAEQPPEEPPPAPEAQPPADEAPEPPTDASESADDAPEPAMDGPDLADEARDSPAHELAGPGAAAGETVLPDGDNRIHQDLDSKAELEVDAAEDAAEQYGNRALRDGPSYQEELDDQLGARGLDHSEHDKLRLTRTNELSEAQAREVVGVRDAIKLDEGQMVTKVVTPETMQAYLDNVTKLGKDKFNPGEFRGSIARGCDTADLRSMDQLRDGLALDDGGAGWTPVPPGASEAYQLRFPAPHDMRADPSLGAVGDRGLADHVAGMAGLSRGLAWDDPFLGTGYTGGGVPEWIAEPTGFPHHAEIWRMHADGSEEAVGFFDKNEGLWNDYV
ncbi:hypothetical protein QZH56_18660 [Streptomyces olivoreticuli]|uniref:hypothetical protein n=1 Tax=Streptomyces olivoreticuli TaxID=68246 RepID=UPI0026592806|nr:hypothetical protein [Streptomyces olivoreticuli]WKK20922.1 hypothetical protein QZH56_18660 [Streptomyces olivoreticuli]